MSTLSAPTRQSPGVVKESMLFAQRGIIQVIRVPERLIDATAQPLLFVILFAYVFGGAIALPGGGSYREYLVAGMVAQTVAFSAMGMALGLATDMQESVIDRFRSLPISRSSVLIGRVLSELMQTSLALLITAIGGLIVGWRIHTDFIHAIAGIGLILLFAFAMQWVGAFIGMIVRSPDAAQGIFFVSLFPLTFASGIFAPTQTMTPVLRVIAQWNPITTLSTAVRHLFGNPTATAGHVPWSLQHPVLLSLVWCAAIISIFSTMSVARFRRSVSR
jgi:ABC-type polysaccharide/polyol phosphate export permease